MTKELTGWNFKWKLLGMLWMCPVMVLGETLLVGFEDVALEGPSVQAYTGPGGGVYYNGMDNSGGFTSDGVYFENVLSDFGDFGTFWTGGWGYSTTTDTETPGFLNEFSAYPGGAREGMVYAVTTNLPSSIKLPVGWKAPTGISVTNTTYAGISMRDGDDFAKKFSTGDYFKLTIDGLDTNGGELGSVEFYLADFREGSGAGYIIDTWEDIDLSVLGRGVAEIMFTLESTDAGEFGMNTPSYFAIDNLALESTPTWGRFDRQSSGWVDTGNFLGWVYPAGEYVYILSLGKYAYLTEAEASSGDGSWVYIPQ